MKRVTASSLLAAGVFILAFAPALKADVAPSPERIQRRLERMREQAVAAANSGARPARSADPASSAAPAPSAAAAGSASPAPSGSSLGALGDELRRKWAQLAATRGDRRERHRAELTRELGASLNDPAIMAELKLHATRQAELERARFLAQNARTGADRDKILARIGTLSAREGGRHRKRMAALLGRGAPAGSAAPSGAPPSSAAAPAPAPSAGARQ